MVLLSEGGGHSSPRRAIREIHHRPDLRCRGPDHGLFSGIHTTRSFTHCRQRNRGGGDACPHANAAVAEPN